jgi:D-arabinose 1-dehydrogenase-like Zn-dependent alcohol dehydrogenase
MAPFGHIYPLTVTNDSLTIPVMGLIGKELSIHGFASSNARDVKEMIDFIVEHKIKPIVEIFPMTQAGITEAFEKLESGRIRYRGVLQK